MKPNDTGNSDGAENNTKNATTNDSTDGELTINHDQGSGNSNPPFFDNHKQIDPQSEPYNPPTPAQVYEPTQNTNEPVNGQPAEPSIVVPGGVSSQAPNPDSFFKSKYENQNTPTGSVYPPAGTFPAANQQPASWNAHSASNGRKKIFIAGSAAAVLIIGIVAYIFGIYIPNKPDNVYSTGLDRTGKALTQVVDKVTQKDQLSKLEKGELNGNFELKFGNETINGTLKSKYDPKKLNATIEAASKVSGEADQNYSANILSEQKEGTDFPSIYFKATGINLLGLDQILPGVGAFDDKWIAIDGDYAKSIAAKFKNPLSSVASSSAKAEAVTSDDVVQLSKSLSNVTKEYALTSTDKSIFVKKSFVAKETVDDTKTYHYTVGYNKENVGAFCKAFNEALTSSTVTKKATGSDAQAIKDQNDAANASCEETKNGLKDSDTLDLWIDAKYKLIYKVRFTDSVKKNAYVEVGQRYKRGDVLTFFINYKDEEQKIDGQAVATINMKNVASNLKAVINSNGDADKGSLTVNVDSKSYDGDITVDKPAATINLKDAAKQIGIDLDAVLTPPAGLTPTNPEQ